jgi:hypothetical protein
VSKSLKLSAIALLTTALTVVPAYAVSLNLGGGDAPVVDLGNGNNANATVGVDTGNVLGGGGSDTNGDAAVDLNLGDIGGNNDNNDNLGNVVDNDGDGGLVNLGGNNDLIDLNSEGDGVIDLGGNGDLLDLGTDGDLLDFGGDGNLLDLGGGGTDGLVDFASLDLGDGLLLDLSGNNGDLLDTGSTGSILDLDGNGDLLDLGGSSEQRVAIDLGNTTIDGSVDPNQPQAQVTISTGNDGAAGTGVLPNTDGSATVGGNSANVTITTGNGSDAGGAGSGGNGGNGGAGGNGAGGNGNGNGAGTGGGSTGGGGSAGGGGNGNGSGDDLFAAAGDANACLTLTAAQLDELIERHAYNRATFNSWANARSLKIVEVDVCDREVAEVEAAAGSSANVARLQAFLAAQAKVRAGLQSKGFSSGDVIAADHSGDVLIVYVI